MKLEKALGRVHERARRENAATRANVGLAKQSLRDVANLSPTARCEVEGVGAAAKAARQAVPPGSATPGRASAARPPAASACLAPRPELTGNARSSLRGSVVAPAEQGSDDAESGRAIGAKRCLGTRHAP